MKGAKAPAYELAQVRPRDVAALCERFHAYQGAGNTAVYAFGVLERGAIVAAYSWQPPPYGAARAVCPEAPYGVLALSRMVACPRVERALRHVSRPLRRQMRLAIDRTRWPVLVTYSDESLGHTGHSYKCSGWSATARRPSPLFVDDAGRRRSSYSNGRHNPIERGLRRAGTSWLQRWEHWVCERGHADAWMRAHGWTRVPVAGRTWRSGQPAHAIVRVAVLPR